MSKPVGMLRGKKIYDNDPRLVDLVCDVEYIAVYGNGSALRIEARCDYCGRTNKLSGDCQSCGAPL